MSKQKTVSAAKKTVVIRKRKSHRIAVFVLSALFILCMNAALFYILKLSELESGISLLLCAAAIIPFLLIPFYFASWKITFHANGIEKQLFWFKLKSRSWTQIKQVRSVWSTSERNYVVCILFNDGKTIRFRMDCDNAENARKLILSHCSIVE